MADKKISQLSSASTPLAGTEVLPIVQSSTTVKVSVADLTAGRTVATGTLNVSGDVAFAGTGRRITGDFSNATQSDRIFFQTTTAGGGTSVGAIPDATGGNSAFNAFGSPDPVNSPLLQLRAGTDTADVRISATRTGSGAFVPMLFFTNGLERARITTDGEVMVAGSTDQGAYNLQVNGTGVWGAGAYVNGSDARIKDDIVPLTSGLDVVAKLKPVQFRYKESWSKDTSVQPGFIAQDLQAALADQPYVDGVVLQGPEYMSVAYQALIPLLTKALQELKADNEALKARVATLENK